VGFDDVQSAAYQHPALTTVRQPLHTMGVLAAEQVLQQIASGVPPSVQQITVSPGFVVRESTAAVARCVGAYRPGLKAATAQRRNGA
jgi:DNA-binding LacI/PurR family transcriptional regulator